MADIVLLSYPYNEQTPAYGGGESFSSESIKSIAGGDTANTQRWTMPNHVGTHIDAPAHFFQGAMSITDYSPAFWFFKHPQLIEVECEAGALIKQGQVEGMLQAETDLLLIRTGFGRYRGAVKYWKSNPGLSAELALWMRDRFPNIRAVGFDFISLTSPLHRDAGKQAHRNFLNPDGNGDPILIIEDMNLSDAQEDMQSVVVAPMIVEKADGAPCTVFGIIRL